MNAKFIFIIIKYQILIFSLFFFFYIYIYKDSDSFLDHSDLEDIDLDYLDSVAIAPFNLSTMNDETRRSLKRIHERTLELEQERRGKFINEKYYILLSL